MNNWQEQTAAWRAEVQDWHPTPGPKSSIDYMVTEAAECLDAALRLLLPQHDARRQVHRLALALYR